MTDTNISTRSFKTPREWRSWLTKHHAKPEGIWLRCFKKASGVKSITYAEALDEALCFGWIDGQRKQYDAKSYLQKFTPRRSKSIWSKRNREHTARLIKEKRMTAAGLKEIALAKKDGRWEGAYASHPTDGSHNAGGCNHDDYAGCGRSVLAARVARVAAGSERGAQSRLASSMAIRQRLEAPPPV